MQFLQARKEMAGSRTGNDIAVLELPAQLDVEVGDTRMVDELGAAGDGGAVEIVGPSCLCEHSPMLSQVSTCQQPHSHAFAIEHGEGEGIECGTFIHIET